MHLYTISTLYMKQIQRTICQDEDETKHPHDLTQIIVYPLLSHRPAHFAGNGRLERVLSFLLLVFMGSLPLRLAAFLFLVGMI